jgi:hypothetical protein
MDLFDAPYPTHAFLFGLIATGLAFLLVQGIVARFEHVGPGLRRAVDDELRDCETQVREENHANPGPGGFKAHRTVYEECLVIVAGRHDRRPWHVDRIRVEQGGD